MLAKIRRFIGIAEKGGGGGRKSQIQSVKHLSPKIFFGWQKAFSFSLAIFSLLSTKYTLLFLRALSCCPGERKRVNIRFRGLRDSPLLVYSWKKRSKLNAERTAQCEKKNEIASPTLARKKETEERQKDQKSLPMGFLSPPPPLVRRQRRPGPCEPLSETDWIGGGRGGGHIATAFFFFPPKTKSKRGEKSKISPSAGQSIT